MSNDSVSNLMRGHMESLAKEGKRADGRGINDFRKVTLKLECLTLPRDQRWSILAILKYFVE